MHAVQRRMPEIVHRFMSHLILRTPIELPFQDSHHTSYVISVILGAHAFVVPLLYETAMMSILVPRMMAHELHSNVCFVQSSTHACVTGAPLNISQYSILGRGETAMSFVNGYRIDRIDRKRGERCLYCTAHHGNCVQRICTPSQPRHNFVIPSFRPLGAGGGGGSFNPSLAHAASQFGFYMCTASPFNCPGFVIYDGSRTWTGGKAPGGARARAVPTAPTVRDLGVL